MKGLWYFIKNIYIFFFYKYLNILTIFLQCCFAIIYAIFWVEILSLKYEEGTSFTLRGITEDTFFLEGA